MLYEGNFLGIDRLFKIQHVASHVLKSVYCKKPKPGDESPGLLRRRACELPVLGEFLMLGTQLCAPSFGDRELSLQMKMGRQIAEVLNCDNHSRNTGLWHSQQQTWVAGVWSVTPWYCLQAHVGAVAASTDGRSVEGKPDGKLGWFICNCLLSFCCVISGMLRKWDNKDMLWEGIMVQQWKMLMKCWKKSFWEWSVHMSIYIAFLMGKVP